MACLWLIHRLTCRRANHDNIHVRGCKEKGAITTPFDMTAQSDLDRFHFMMDTIASLPQIGMNRENASGNIRYANDAK